MVTFTVPGRPVPKQRPRLGRYGKAYTPGKSKQYEQHVAWAARPFFKSPFLGPVSLQVHVFLSRRGGDLDNYVKSIQDGLNGVAWRDDRQVKRLVANVFEKRGQNERAEIIVDRLSLV